MNCPCGRALPKPEPGKAGRRRTRCEFCSPSRPRRKPPAAIGAPPVVVPPAPPVDETLTNAVRAELGDRAGTVDGVLAMKIAKLIDHGNPTISALAAGTKQMRAHITAATAGRPAAEDDVTGIEDEFEARQRARAARSA